MRKKRGRGRGPQLNRGPFTGPHILAQLKRVGYVQEPGTKHLALSHPDRPGKVSVAAKWTSVKAGSEMFNSLVHQTGYTKVELLRVLNELAPTESPPDDPPDQQETGSR